MRKSIFLLMLIVSDWNNAAQPEAAKAQYEKVVSICKVVTTPNNYDDAENFNWVALESIVITALGSAFNVNDKLAWDYINSSMQVTLLSGPKHGVLAPDTKFLNSYKYLANAGYTGMDQMTFEIKLDGKTYKGIYMVYVTLGSPHNYSGCNEKGAYDDLEGPFRSYGNGKYERLDANGNWIECSKKEVIKWMNDHRQ